MADISVIIPTYNDGRFLSTCLQSVFCQTMAVSEVLIVDDGTDNDRDRAALSEVKEHYKAVRFLSQKNLGPAAARNLGFAASMGEYLVFIDADDRLREDCIEERFKRISHDPEVGAVYAGYKSISDRGHGIHSRFAEMTRQIPSVSLIGRRGGIPGGMPLYMFRRSTLQLVGGVDESLSIMEDFDLIIRIIRARQLISGTNEPTYLRIRRAGSHSRRSAMTRLSGTLKFLMKARKAQYFGSLELAKRFALALMESVS